MLAIIGGSGLTKLPELEITERKIVRTPYGLTSSPILFGRLGRLDIVFLARHGFSHTIAPHEINYRANIWALHSLGVENIIAISSVVGINPDFENGSLVLPDDLIDYTYGRKDTFFEVKNARLSIPIFSTLIAMIATRIVEYHESAQCADLRLRRLWLSARPAPSNPRRNRPLST